MNTLPTAIKFQSQPHHRVGDLIEYRMSYYRITRIDDGTARARLTSGSAMTQIGARA